MAEACGCGTAYGPTELDDPLVTVTPRLEQEFRADFDFMNQGNGSHGQLEAAAAAILPVVGPGVALTPLLTSVRLLLMRLTA